ncbi:glycosyltransferase family 2 protein [Euzebya tangerina]|uniref:glycosyltransferase family 2 protein n=1 Tax=Euzebya tangerina TaxID=591198 RepID=UPI000E3136F8|nr:glycosyltransferase family 2 protein [Euzebya tangerina]
MASGSGDSYIAYLVVCWNNVDVISMCLEAIAAQTEAEHSVLVLDNNSSDGTAGHVKATHLADSRVRLFRSGSNLGFAKGVNALIPHALADPRVTHVALINSDAILDPAWAAELMGGLADKQRVACAQGTTLDFDDRALIDSTHIYIRSDLQGAQYGYTEVFRPEHAWTRQVFGVNAAAGLFSRAFIESQPGHQLFDSRFYMYLEDVDVAFRSTMEGWNNYYVPSARAYHMGSVSSSRRASHYNYFMTWRNHTAVLVKNAPLRTIAAHLPRLLLAEYAFYRHMQVTGETEVFSNVSRGRLAGLARAPLYLGSRVQLWRRRRIDHAKLERFIAGDGMLG